MKGFPTILSLVLPTLLAFGACSVLEDRDPCPCRLSLVWVRSGVLSALPEKTLVLSLRNTEEELISRESLPLSAFTDAGVFALTVPKEERLSVCGICGLSRSQSPQDWDIRIPEGRPADSLWLFSLQTDSRCESLTLPVRIRKEYAGLEISFAEALENPEAEFPYFLRLIGESCGLDLTTGDPIPGTFDCRMTEVSPGVFRSTLPRQRPSDALVVELWSKESGKAEADGPANRISLDELIADTRAFSWLDEDLKDLRIRIDYAQAALQITVLSWEGSSDPYHYSI